MAKLPGVAPAPLAKQQQGSRYAANAEWTGPVDLGREAMLRDLALRNGWDLVNADRAEHSFAAWTREEEARFDEAVAALKPAEADGFAERTTRDLFERAKLFRASLPPGFGAAIDDRLNDYERRLFNKAAAVEDRAQLRAVREHLDASLQATAIPAARAIAALPAGDPDRFDRFIKLKTSRFELIDRNPALSPYQKQQRKAAEATAIDTAFAEALSPQEKQDLDPEAPIETVGGRIHRLAQETQAADRAENDTRDDSEAGEGAPANPEGFGGEAWLDLIRRLRPDLAEGRRVDEIQALRADPKLAAEVRETGLADSARFLARNGHEVTPASRYLAHVTSRETALRLLQADPDSLAIDVDPVAAPARPDLFHVDGDETRPRTVGEVIALADEAMGGTRLVDLHQELGGMSPEMRRAIAADGRAAAAEANLAEDEAYRTRIAETETAIDAATFGHTDLVKAVEEGLVKGEDAQRLLNRLAKRSATALEYEAALSKYLDPKYQFDPDSPDDQRAVDLIYERGPLDDATAVLDGDPQARDAFRRILARTGIVPTPVQLAADTAISSEDEAARRRALALLEDTLLWTADETIPERTKERAEVISDIRNFYHRKRGNIGSIAEIVAKVEEFRNEAIRGAIGIYFGQGAVSIYDWGLGYLDERAAELREYFHRLIDEGNESRSALEIANRKNFFDGLFTVAMVAAPGPGLGRGRGRIGGSRRKGTVAEYDLDRETFQKLGYSKDDGNGNLGHVDTRKIDGIEYRVFRIRTKQESGGASDAAGPAEFRALNEPEANAIYELDNGTMFRTNEAGRVDRREFTPGPKNNRSRGPKLEEEAPEGYETAHVQGIASGGSSDKSNLFYQHRNFNRGAYVVWEKRTRNLKAQRVRVDFIRIDDPRTLAPDELHASYLVDGEWYETVFKNGPGGK